MSKFKVGDRVRCIKSDSCPQLTKNEIYTVQRVNELYVYVTAAGRGEILGGYWHDRFALVEQAKNQHDSALEQLVATANAGMAAYRELYLKYHNRVQINNVIDRPEPLALVANPSLEIPRTIMIRPETKAAKPEFTPFKIKEGYTVNVRTNKDYDDDLRVSIGCKEFDMNYMIMVFRDLIERDRPFRGRIYATRLGPCLEPDGEGISWGSAETILNALEDYQEKLNIYEESK